MNNLRYFILSFFYSMLCFSQESDSIAIYLKDACQQKNVNNAKVTLEGYKKKPIIAKYNSTKKYYYFENIPIEYNTIFVTHSDFETEGIQENNGFPKRINLQLNCKGNIRETRTKELVSSELRSGVSYAVYKTDTIFTGSVVVRDNYKVKISIKKSYNLSFNEVKRKIDSIVMPYGLEYIDNLVPDMFFAHFNGLMINSNSEKSFSTQSLDKTKSMSDLLLDQESILGSFNKYGDFVKDSPYSFWDYYYFQLLYRKKDKTAFRGDSDLLINEIEVNNKELILNLLYYDKFFIGGDYPLNISCKNLSKYDNQIMNYQFLKDYDNDSTRVLFMDEYFEHRPIFLAKHELDKIIDGEVVYVPAPHRDRSNFNYKLELSKNK
ncbi:hypothetical protein E0I26_13180 [Flavobacterium rhamnosiphilum]|uniref:Uncharacterized protein n=1 Tax=Flavobacterium rhamnosiphilum TaxID=2541724 RepID=A0A4R5F5A1_9FLAO|nr:hypothetical protein [Flavobacterium rhamnosiphilum]TDE42812.1 hypothetical protein E0I26_13180 [Flavobacterium rhamnosiphilum]